MSNTSDQSVSGPSKPSGFSSTKKKKISSLDDTIQAGTSQAFKMNHDSKNASNNEKPGGNSVVKSGLGEPTTTDSSSNVSTSGGPSEINSCDSSNSTISTQKRQAASPSSPSSSSSKRVKLSDGSVSSKKSEGTLSFANFTSDRDGGRDDNNSDSESLSDTKPAEVLRVESPSPKIEPPASTSKSNKVSKRTPLPNIHTKRSRSPVAPAPKPVKRGSKWAAEEEALLVRLRIEGKNWDYISERMPGRSMTACRRHHDQSSKTSATTSKKNIFMSAKTSRNPANSDPTAPRKGRWTKEEIDELKRLKIANVEWAEIAKQLPGRTPSACRRKWEQLRKEARKSPAEGASKVKQETPESAMKEGEVESRSDDKFPEKDVKEEKAKREIVEDSYSCDGDEEMSENVVGDQVPEGKIEEEDAEIVRDESDTSSDSEEEPSDSGSEDEAMKKRQHATFFRDR